MTIAQRRWTAWAVFVIVDVLLVFGVGHRGVHAFRSLILPGAGLYDHNHLYIGIAFTVLALLATLSWLQWGTDIILIAVVLTAVITSALVDPNIHSSSTVQQSAHEFPLIIVIAGALSWIRVAFGKTGLVRKVPQHLDGIAHINSLPPVQRCQAATIAELAGVSVEIATADIDTRARRINLFARGKVTTPPYFRYHSYARTMKLARGEASVDEIDAFITESRNSPLGVPDSEPTWSRFLDSTLAAIAMHKAGETHAVETWSRAMNTHFAPRKGHRPSSIWTPLAIRMTHAAPWEHATATALAHAEGLLDSSDWQYVRKSSLGAAARGARTTHDQRLVAAGRMWATMLKDEAASHILNKPAIGSDPMAAALNAYAQSLRSQSTSGEMT